MIDERVHSMFDRVGDVNFYVRDGTILATITKRSPPRCIYLELYINTDTIHVNNIDNCEDPGMGRSLLTKVEELARQIERTKITLLDASKIKINWRYRFEYYGNLCSRVYHTFELVFGDARTRIFVFEP
jgi:hypothetical protein